MVVVFILASASGLMLGACGASTPRTASTGVSPRSVTTEFVETDPPTTVITYPNPYEPSYDTIASLADESDLIVVATVGSRTPDGYPLYGQTSLGPAIPKVSIGIGEAEFVAAHLTVGGTYVFFHASDPVDKAVCIVGGVRGAFAYDPTTQIVTRLDHNPTSRIPRTQTLTQLETALRRAEKIVAGRPTANIPPVCVSSATGISG